MKGAARHRFIYKFAKFLLMNLLKRIFSYSFDPVVPVSTPYIVLSNHVTNVDPMLVGLAFQDSMYFVASDHLFRMGWISRLLVFAVSPIARAKATTDTQTVRQILSRLKEGLNVCIFAEGNSTFSGVTGEIPSSIGKLARRSGAALITYRLRGGYFTFPRWSRTVRKGRMYGEVAHQYTSKELMGMTDEEVGRLVIEDLYVNAYEDQAASPVAYVGKTPAEQLENALYCCPNCKSYSTLTSKDDLFFCTCGYAVRFTPYGYFEAPAESSVPVLFKTVADWYFWQLDMLHDRLNARPEADDGPLFSDRGQRLFHTIRATRNIPLGTGLLEIYRDRLVFTPESGTPRIFLFRDIADMSVITRMTLIFSTTDRESYEIHSDFPRSAGKYLETYRFLKPGIS